MVSDVEFLFLEDEEDLKSQIPGPNVSVGSS